LQRGGVFGHHFGCLGQFVGGLQFAVGGDDAGPSFAFGFGLARH
jgi:hypothetical protein